MDQQMDIQGKIFVPNLRFKRGKILLRKNNKTESFSKGQIRQKKPENDGKRPAC